MHHNTKIFAATCAALAITASMAFAAGTNTNRAGSAENAGGSWACPGAQYGRAAFERMGYGYGGCGGYRAERSDYRHGRHMGYDVDRDGYDRDAAPRSTTQNRNL